MNATIQDAIEQSSRGEMSYPVFAGILRQEGIHHYHVDVRTHTSTFHGPGEPFTLQRTAIAAAGEPGPFHAEGVREAIRANQRREIDYEGFLERIWRSGVTRYDVDLEARTVTYRGEGGEAYVEGIPDAASPG